MEKNVVSERNVFYEKKLEDFSGTSFMHVHFRQRCGLGDADGRLRYLYGKSLFSLHAEQQRGI